MSDQDDETRIILRHDKERKSVMLTFNQDHAMDAADLIENLEYFLSMVIQQGDAIFDEGNDQIYS
jgi:hypothetical protein